VLIVTVGVLAAVRRLCISAHDESGVFGSVMHFTLGLD
jgi:hypothetical protein